ncbi:MAG: matrixin family metalloprotease [Candidatus Obscuribacterales bacterium]|nr:matrixin family metalloprotease [Candidatus Obscuribacterales bacterium]
MRQNCSVSLSITLITLISLTLVSTESGAAVLKNGVLNFAKGEVEDREQSNTFVKVVKRPDGSMQVFYYDPDAGNRFVQKTVPAGQSLKISYWNSSGQRIRQEIRTSGEASAPEVASTAKPVATKRDTPPVASKSDSNASGDDAPAVAAKADPAPSLNSSNDAPPVAAKAAPAPSLNSSNDAPPVAAKADPAPSLNSSNDAPPVAAKAAPAPSLNSSNDAPPVAAKADPAPSLNSSNDAPPVAAKADPAPSLNSSNDTPVAAKADPAPSLNSSNDAPPVAAKANPAPSANPVQTTNNTPSADVPPSSASVQPQAKQDDSDPFSDDAAAPPPTPSVSSADIPKFDPFALVPTMTTKPTSTAPSSAASSSSSAKPVITQVATSGDSFIASTNTSLGPCVWKKFPIKVYMDPAPGATGSQLESEVKEAFEIWTKVTGNKIRFEFTPKQSANITISWTPTTAGFRDPSEAGESSVDYSTPPGPKRTWDNPGDITRAKVRFSITDINHKEWLPGQFKLLVLHEIGHSLGVFGHSNNANDIMYSLKGAPALSQRDINTVNILYKSVSGY